MLPLEARELRAAEDALRGVFHTFGYREVRTPVMEFAQQLERGYRDPLEHVVRLFDEAGRVVVLRPDLTVPVARLLATRMTEHPGPLRVEYTGPAFRAPQAGVPVATEHRQSGAELVGLAGPEADAEIITMLGRALRAAGLGSYRIGISDVSLTAAVLDGLGIEGTTRAALRSALAARDLVAWNDRAGAAPLSAPDRELLERLPSMRGGVEVPRQLAASVPAAAEAAARLERTIELVDLADADVLVDLSIQRDWGYYTGLLLEAFAPGVGAPIAQGGRYDAIGEWYGHARPAVGFSIALELLHRALAAASEGAPARQRGVVLAGGLDTHRAVAEQLRNAQVPVVAVAAGDAAANLADAEGWRYSAGPDGEGLLLRDHENDSSTSCSDAAELLAALA